MASSKSVIRAHRAGLVRVARHEGLGAEDALDATHEALGTFLQLLQAGAAPADRTAWPAYVTAVVRNAARNGRRRHHRSKPHDAPLALAATDGASVEALVAQAEDHVRLRACVARLCETQRSVVTLRLLEERDGEDVATLLGISRGYVDVLLHRAKASLRACMSE